MRGGLFTFFATVLCATGTYAQVFTPARGLSDVHMNLDTAPGHFSILELNDLCGLNALRTTLTPLAMAKDKKWGASTTIYVQSENSSAGFVLVAGNTTEFVAYAVFGESDKEQSRTILPLTVKLKQDVAVAVDWSNEGDVLVKAGDAAFQLKLNGPPTTLSISTSTGEMNFKPLRIGYTGPEPTCPAKP